MSPKDEELLYSTAQLSVLIGLYCLFKVVLTDMYVMDFQVVQNTCLPIVMEEECGNNRGRLWYVYWYRGWFEYSQVQLHEKFCSSPEFILKLGGRGNTHMDVSV